MDGNYMNAGSTDPTASQDLFGQSTMAITSLEQMFDDSLLGTDGLDFNEYLNSQYVNNDWCLELVPDDAQIHPFPYLPGAPPLFGQPENVDNNFIHSLKRAMPDAPDGLEDHDDDEDIGARPKPKRLKAIPNGYPCSHCDKTFDRAADLNKHERRAHTPEDKKLCSCPKCDKRFHYPKDVARHERQIHGAVGALLRMSANSQHPHDPASRITSGGESKPGMNMATALFFSRSVVMLKGRLRLRRKSTVEKAAAAAGTAKFVFVTTDKRNFRPLDVGELDTFGSVIEAVRNEFDVSAQHQLSFQRCTLGSELEEAMDADQVTAALKKEADAHGTLKLHLTIVKQEPASP